jgi:exopolysaccharide biosynthesis polyprenyl glycosylphosphotransferase
MTPRVAERLTIHVQDAVAQQLRAHREGTVDVPGRARPARRFRLIEGGEGWLPSTQRREAVQRRLLAAGDVLAATLALWLVLTLPGSGDQFAPLLVLAGMPLVVLVFKIAGLYDRDPLRIAHSTLDEAPTLLQLTGLYVLSVTILQSVVVKGTLGGDQILALWAASFVAVVALRIVMRWLGSRSVPAERCLVIGESARADRIRQKLASSGARSTVVATFGLEGEDDLHPLDPTSVRTIVQDLQVHRIILAPTTAESHGVVDLIRIAKAAGARVSVLPRMLEVVGSAVEFDDLDGMTVLGVRQFGLSRSSRTMKRGFDIAVTSLGLIAVAPVLAALAIAIRLDSRGSIFFRQVRIGRDGEPFEIFKFRSMVTGADGQKDALRDFNEVGDGMFKISSDPRVTRVGRFLRGTSLDELPQLFNVLRGEMSLVGPRPLVVDEDALVLGLDRSRLHLTPGMTGPWQVLGARVPMQEMVGIDYLYVSSWSLWLDVKLLLRTVRHVLRRGNV